MFGLGGALVVESLCVCPSFLIILISKTSTHMYKQTHTHIQTNPKVDKGQFNQQGVIAMKQEGASFPLNQDVGVLKWRFQTTDESFLPLSSE